jgi:type IV fimbrial biogenesis protein FimT
MRRTLERGFTLLELMVALSIATILAVIAVPSYQGLIARNRAVTEANSMLGLFTYARNEAVKRNATVNICKTSSGTSCSTAGTISWANGILIWSDTDGDGAVDGNEIIRAVVPFSTGSTITVSGSGLQNSYGYRATGLGNSSTGSFTIRTGSDSAYAYTLTINSTGRPYVSAAQ